jgi:hypothetical protein
LTKCWISSSKLKKKKRSDNEALSRGLIDDRGANLQV